MDVVLAGTKTVLSLHAIQTNETRTFPTLGVALVLTQHLLALAAVSLLQRGTSRESGRLPVLILHSRNRAFAASRLDKNDAGDSWLSLRLLTRLPSHHQIQSATLNAMKGDLCFINYF